MSKFSVSKFKSSQQPTSTYLQPKNVVDRPYDLYPDLSKPTQTPSKPIQLNPIRERSGALLIPTGKNIIENQRVAREATQPNMMNMFNSGTLLPIIIILLILYFMT